MNSIEHIHNAFFDYLTRQYSLTPQQLKAVTFTINVDENKKNFGDISSNAALILAPAMAQKPPLLARSIASSFIHPLIEKIEVAGPGFLNLFLTQEAVQLLARQLFEQGEGFFKHKEHSAKNYSLEFVSANPTGPLHLGHGRGGIIGDVLGNILTFLGNKVTKEFYINDAGSQIQKLGRSLKIRCQQLLGEDVQLPEEAYHGEYLVAVAKECVKKNGKNVLDKPDSFFAQYGKEVLLEQIKQTLADYGIHFNEWFSEKTLHESGALEKAINKLTQSGNTYEQDGALWFTSTKYGDDKDRVLRKKDGELTYVAADVAYLINKINRGFDHLIMILGQDHHSYVVRLNGILQALGYNSSLLDVILYQLVTLKESGELVRMSKRTGKIITLKDVIETVGTDVARFFYLNRKADAHLEFDLSLALKKSEENPVYYIQYAYVRMGSILNKAHEIAALNEVREADLKYIGKEEIPLIKKIITLKQLLGDIAHHYQTHILTYYVLELAHTFHRYYRDNRVIDPDNIEKSRARLMMLKILRQTFALCLTLLGISKPEKM